MSLLRLALLVLSASSLAACGGDDGPGGGGGGDGGRRDSGRADGGRTDGGGTSDAGTDAGADLCGDVECEPFEFCTAGECRAYMGCVSTSMCPAGHVCLHRFCLPEDSDPDEDGVPAGEDCDETDPTRHPGAPEVCNGVDDDCNEMVDDGDPSEMCAMDPSGGVCMEGRCGCPDGTYDLDRDTSNGCECTAMPATNVGSGCSMAIDLGDLSDVGQTVTVSGNVLPDDREVWYRFRGLDGADTTCDNYHVRVQLTDNPGDAFGFEVHRGACGTAECAGMGLMSDYRWATDFYDGATATGECPCVPSPGTAGNNVCDDDTTEYFVRVVRRPGSTVSCDAYTLEVTNGVYDS